MELYNAMFRLCLIADCQLPVPMPLYVVCCMLLSDWLLDLSHCCKLALVNLGYLARSLIALIEPSQAEGKRRTIVVWQVDVGNTFNQQVHCCRITQQLGKKINDNHLLLGPSSLNLIAIFKISFIFLCRYILNRSSKQEPINHFWLDLSNKSQLPLKSRQSSN